MADISRNITVAGTDNSTSYSVTLGGDVHLVFISYNFDGASMTGVTVGGHAMTKQVDQPTEGGGSLASERIACYTYIGTLSGSQAVTISGIGSATIIRSYWMGYDGATAIDGVDSSFAFENPYSNTITSATGNAWIIGGLLSESTTALSSLVNFSTVLNNSNDPEGGMRRAMGDSNGTVGAGSHNQRFSNGGNNASFITYIHSQQATSRTDRSNQQWYIVDHVTDTS